MLSLNILLKASNWICLGRRTTCEYSTACLPEIDAETAKISGYRHMIENMVRKR